MTHWPTELDLFVSEPALKLSTGRIPILFRSWPSQNPNRLVLLLLSYEDIVMRTEDSMANKVLIMISWLFKYALVHRLTGGMRN